MKVLGFDEGFTTCDCCGKANLKGTFTVENADGDMLHYGSTCVTRHTGKAAKIVRQEAKQALEDRKEAASRELYSHPAVLADEAKMSEAHSLRLIGREFAEHHAAEAVAALAVRAEIAARYGLRMWGF